MTPIDIAVILALTVYSLYKQSQVGPVREHGRFKMAVIYVIVGLCVGGIDMPSGTAGIAMVASGILLSVVVGVSRGFLTKVWRDADGTVLKQGTALTIGLFLGMIAIKFAMGAWASIKDVDDGAGIGEVLIMLGLMIGIQAEIVWRRGRSLVDAARPSVGAR
jgi:hypothetical protein